MTTKDVTRISDTLRDMTRGLVNLYPDGIPAADVPNLASALLLHADNVGKVEHMLERKLNADDMARRQKRPPRAAWDLGEAPAAGDNLIQFRPRGHTLPVDVPVGGGVA